MCVEGGAMMLTLTGSFCFRICTELDMLADMEMDPSILDPDLPDAIHDPLVGPTPVRSHAPARVSTDASCALSCVWDLGPTLLCVCPQNVDVLLLFMPMRGLRGACIGCQNTCQCLARVIM